MHSLREIYTLDARKKIRVWSADVVGPRWRTVAGLLGGRLVASEWTTCKGKQGRSHDQQAFFEAHAERTKKLKRDYRETLDEIYSLPPGPMLAQNYEPGRVASVPVFSQPKLDGIRALISSQGPFSREFQPHHNVEHIVEALAPIFRVFPSIILDGELYNHDLRDDFNEISSVVRTTNVYEEDRERSRKILQFHVYDVMLPENRPFSFRIDFLRSIFRMLLSSADSPVVLVETTRAMSLGDIDTFYGLVLAEGYEGQIVRLDGPYENKRSKQLLKRKEFITEEFEITDILEGEGNWSGRAKKVEFIFHEDRRSESGKRPKAGIRGNMEFARKLLENKHEYIGKQATVRYFTPTPIGVPRFAVVTDFHPRGRRD